MSYQRVLLTIPPTWVEVRLLLAHGLRGQAGYTKTSRDREEGRHMPPGQWANFLMQSSSGLINIH